MSIAVPGWAQSDIASIRANRSLGEGATRQNMPAEQASQIDALLSGSMDQLKQMDEGPSDLARGRPGVVQQALPLPPGMEMPVKIDPPTTTFEGDRSQGSSVTVMENPMMNTVTVTDYSPDSITSITVLGGMMPGTQLMHVDRKNPGNSFVEMKGEVWNMMGGMMAGGLPGMG